MCGGGVNHRVSLSNPLCILYSYPRAIAVLQPVSLFSPHLSLSTIYPVSNPHPSIPGAFGMDMPVVKKQKLSAYSQDIRWEEEEDEEEENVSIDPSSFFSK
eukprot:sb/3478543/